MPPKFDPTAITNGKPLLNIFRSRIEAVSSLVIWEYWNPFINAAWISVS
jgi:hypothetical protein